MLAKLLAFYTANKAYVQANWKQLGASAVAGIVLEHIVTRLL